MYFKQKFKKLAIKLIYSNEKLNYLYVRWEIGQKKKNSS